LTSIPGDAVAEAEARAAAFLAKRKEIKYNFFYIYSKLCDVL
jgi:hypothetical protein